MPSGYYKYGQFNIHQFHVLPTQYIYVFCVDLRTNSDYFPIQYLLTGFWNRDLTLYSPLVTICTAQWSLYVPHTGHYMYHQFNIQQFYVLPTQCIYVFCVDLRTNNDYFPIQH